SLVLCGNLPSSITSVFGNSPVLAHSERRLRPKTVRDSRAKIALLVVPSILDLWRRRTKMTKSFSSLVSPAGEGLARALWAVRADGAKWQALARPAQLDSP